MRTQTGSFFPGMIVGILIGVAVSLGVALYVTRAPVPFVDKVPTHTAEQDAAEEERNRNWDPNAPLHGRNPARPQPPAPAPSAVEPAEPAKPASSADSVPPAGAQPEAEQATDAQAVQRPAPAAAEANEIYFVQTGAFARMEDAEQQRARLAMLGLTARITEREQAGRTVYRVRVGPFNVRGDAESVRERVAGNGLEAALVRMQR